MSDDYLLPWWQPNERFSIFGFGTPITPHVLAGYALRVPDQGPVPHATYRCAELDALILTVDQVITRMIVATCCLFEGQELIGRDEADVKEILGSPPIEWEYPEPCWLERLGTIPSLGAMLDVSVERNWVHSLSLWGPWRPATVH